MIEFGPNTSSGLSKGPSWSGPLFPIAAGDIFESPGSKRRVVVYLVTKDGSIFYEELPRGGGGGYCGPGAGLRFIRDYGLEPVARMRFQGAHKLYRHERERRYAAERRVRELETELADACAAAARGFQAMRDAYAAEIEAYSTPRWRRRVARWFS